jgi:hypothetical protein
MFSARIRIACVLAAVAVGAQGCKAPDSVETVIVYLKNTETFQYRTVGGDEEGATMITPRLKSRPARTVRAPRRTSRGLSFGSASTTRIQ